MSTNIEFVALVYHRMENPCKGHFARKKRCCSLGNFCKTIERQGLGQNWKSIGNFKGERPVLLPYGETFAIYPVQIPENAI
jgi:hypothetical protein